MRRDQWSGDSANLHNKDIFLPQQEMLYPAQEALAWHRDEVFRQ